MYTLLFLQISRAASEAKLAYSNMFRLTMLNYAHCYWTLAIDYWLYYKTVCSKYCIAVRVRDFENFEWFLVRCRGSGPSASAIEMFFVVLDSVRADDLQFVIMWRSYTYYIRLLENHSWLDVSAFRPSPLNTREWDSCDQYIYIYVCIVTQPV